MGMPNITSVFLNVTNTCNLACKYCFVAQNPKRITLQTAKDAADWVASNVAGTHDTPSINFFGGEPLIMWDDVIKPLTDYIREKYGSIFALSMTSNCTLMTEEIASYMRANNFGLLLSMDGAKETQDENRPMKNGGSSFDVLDEKIPMLLEYFPTLMFRSTVTPNTASMLYENAMYAESKGFSSWFVMPNHFEEWTENDVATLRAQMEMYTDHYIEKMRAGERPIFFTHMEGFFQRILSRNYAIVKDVRRGSKCSSCAKCGLGASRFAGININGDVTACQEFFSHEGNSVFTIGNIYTGIDDERRAALCAEWDSAEAVGDDCSSCPLDRICDGGCVANNYFISGDMHRMPYIACEWNRILYENAIKVMQTLGNEDNKDFVGRWKRYVR